VHNDSGDKPRIYAVNAAGKLMGTYTLAGATNVDWEDMSIGPVDRAHPERGGYLYLADIGDNRGRRDSVTIYRVAEPRVKGAAKPIEKTIDGVTAYTFTYEDGPRDAESFFVDPLTGDFYVASKRELDGNRLYRAAAESLKPGAGNQFHRILTFGFTGATGGTISADGMQIIIRRYSSATNPLIPASGAATYWRRPNASISISDLLRQPGAILPLAVETQGEAVAFAPNGKGFYTTGERGDDGEASDSPLHFYAAR
jgi:hypothetical protein